MIKTVAILGAGHGGCAAAADLTLRGFAVRLHARNAERLAPLRAIGGVEVRGVHEGLVKLPCMTTRVAEAVEGADLVMLVVPSVAHETYAKELAPLLTPELPVFRIQATPEAGSTSWRNCGAPAMTSRFRPARR